jgi:hypothetical protein
MGVRYVTNGEEERRRMRCSGKAWQRKAEVGLEGVKEVLKRWPGEQSKKQGCSCAPVTRCNVTVITSAGSPSCMYTYTMGTRQL